MLIGGQVRTKRLLDLALGWLGLMSAAPIFVAVGLAMRLRGDRGSFLFRARRVGEGGRPITVLKIRTMREGAPGTGITGEADPRITPLGRFLRRYRIDELPQLINVVRGDMSLVGPRPEDPRFVDWSDPIHRRVFCAKPGITGLAQLEFHDEARLLGGTDVEERYRREVLPAKLQLDLRYLDQRSTLLDLKILARTVRTMLADEAGGPPELERSAAHPASRDGAQTIPHASKQTGTGHDHEADVTDPRNPEIGHRGARHPARDPGERQR
jgi:lipopolysaccharide/colanic/teichoic acid biosynthesis glycosyltransferase